MTLNLTPEQAQALRAGDTLRLTDPTSSAIFVLVPEAAYLRVQSLLTDGPLSDDERKTILRGVWQRAEWDDPAWDEYAQLVPEKPAQ
jgi:hypothetical protein